MCTPESCAHSHTGTLARVDLGTHRQNPMVPSLSADGTIFCRKNRETKCHSAFWAGSRHREGASAEKVVKSQQGL